MQRSSLLMGETQADVAFWVGVKLTLKLQDCPAGSVARQEVLVMVKSPLSPPAVNQVRFVRAADVLFESWKD